MKLYIKILDDFHILLFEQNRSQKNEILNKAYQLVYIYIYIYIGKAT